VQYEDYGTVTIQSIGVADPDPHYLRSWNRIHISQNSGALAAQYGALKGLLDQWSKIRIAVMKSRIRIHIQVKYRIRLRIEVKSWMRIRNPASNNLKRTIACNLPLT
jgi:hypothetical protein